MLAINLSGTLTTGPQSSSDSPFPANSGTIPLVTQQDPKAYNVIAQGAAIVANPNAFETIPGVGAGSVVTQGTFLYIKVSAPMTLRLTTAVPSLSDNVFTVTPFGLFMMEFDAAHYLKLLEVEGSGTIEYVVTGMA